MKHLAMRWLALGAIVGLLSQQTAFAAEEQPAEQAEQPKIQMAILLDTSGSMDGLINQARTQIWKIVNELATAKQNGQSPQLEVALYEYGKSTIPAEEGYLRMIVPLTDDLDKISEELFALATNGGEEYCGQVIQSATRGLEWSKNEKDLKLIFIAGNEPFTQGQVNYKDACQEAINKGIIVNTIHCGPENVGLETGWADGAKLADGSFMNIDQNKVVAEIKTPYDEKIVKLSAELNKTYFAYGKEEKRKEVLERQNKQDELAKEAAPAAPVQRAATKASGLYNNATWDLIDGIRDGKVKLEELKKEDLPEEMQKMTLEEQKAFLEKKSKEREELQKEIKKLSAEREKFVIEERKKQSEEDGAQSLDEALIQTLRDQATKKDFQFEKSPEN